MTNLPFRPLPKVTDIAQVLRLAALVEQPDILHRVPHQVAIRQAHASSATGSQSAAMTSDANDGSAEKRGRHMKALLPTPKASTPPPAGKVVTIKTEPGLHERSEYAGEVEFLRTKSVKSKSRPGPGDDVVGMEEPVASRAQVAMTNAGEESMATTVAPTETGIATTSLSPVTQHSEVVTTPISSTAQIDKASIEPNQEPKNKNTAADSQPAEDRVPGSQSEVPVPQSGNSLVNNEQAQQQSPSAHSTPPPSSIEVSEGADAHIPGVVTTSIVPSPKLPVNPDIEETSSAMKDSEMQSGGEVDLQRGCEQPTSQASPTAPITAQQPEQVSQLSASAPLATSPAAKPESGSNAVYPLPDQSKARDELLTVIAEGQPIFIHCHLFQKLVSLRNVRLTRSSVRSIFADHGLEESDGEKHISVLFAHHNAAFAEADALELGIKDSPLQPSQPREVTEIHEYTKKVYALAVPGQCVLEYWLGKLKADLVAARYEPRQSRAKLPSLEDMYSGTGHDAESIAHQYSHYQWLKDTKCTELEILEQAGSDKYLERFTLAAKHIPFEPLNFSTNTKLLSDIVEAERRTSGRAIVDHVDRVTLYLAFRRCAHTAAPFLELIAASSPKMDQAALERITFAVSCMLYFRDPGVSLTKDHAALRILLCVSIIVNHNSRTSSAYISALRRQTPSVNLVMKSFSRVRLERDRQVTEGLLGAVEDAVYVSFHHILKESASAMLVHHLVKDQQILDERKTYLNKTNTASDDVLRERLVHDLEPAVRLVARSILPRKYIAHESDINGTHDEVLAYIAAKYPFDEHGECLYHPLYTQSLLTSGSTDTLTVADWLDQRLELPQNFLSKRCAAETEQRIRKIIGINSKISPKNKRITGSVLHEAIHRGLCEEEDGKSALDVKSAAFFRDPYQPGRLETEYAWQRLVSFDVGSDLPVDKAVSIEEVCTGLRNESLDRFKSRRLGNQYQSVSEQAFLLQCLSRFHELIVEVYPMPMEKVPDLDSDIEMEDAPPKDQLPISPGHPNKSSATDTCQQKPSQQVDQHQNSSLEPHGNFHSNLHETFQKLVDQLTPLDVSSSPPKYKANGGHLALLWKMFALPAWDLLTGVAQDALMDSFTAGANDLKHHSNTSFGKELDAAIALLKVSKKPMGDEDIETEVDHASIIIQVSRISMICTSAGCSTGSPDDQPHIIKAYKHFNASSTDLNGKIQTLVYIKFLRPSFDGGSSTSLQCQSAELLQRLSAALDKTMNASDEAPPSTTGMLPAITDELSSQQLLHSNVEPLRPSPGTASQVNNGDPPVDTKPHFPLSEDQSEKASRSQLPTPSFLDIPSPDLTAQLASLKSAWRAESSVYQNCSNNQHKYFQQIMATIQFERLPSDVRLAKLISTCDTMHHPWADVIPYMCNNRLKEVSNGASDSESANQSEEESDDDSSPEDDDTGEGNVSDDSLINALSAFYDAVTSNGILMYDIRQIGASGQEIVDIFLSTTGSLAPADHTKRPSDAMLVAGILASGTDQGRDNKDFCDKVARLCSDNIGGQDSFSAQDVLKWWKTPLLNFMGDNGCHVVGQDVLWEKPLAQGHQKSQLRGSPTKPRVNRDDSVDTAKIMSLWTVALKEETSTDFQAWLCSKEKVMEYKSMSKTHRLVFLAAATYVGSLYDTPQSYHQALAGLLNTELHGEIKSNPHAGDLTDANVVLWYQTKHLKAWMATYGFDCDAEANCSRDDKKLWKNLETSRGIGKGQNGRDDDDDVSMTEENDESAEEEKDPAGYLNDETVEEFDTGAAEEDLVAHFD